MQITYKEELAPVSFIAGDYQEFEYTVVDVKTGQTVETADGATMKLVLFRYGEMETPALVVEGYAKPEFLGGSSGVVFTVNLTSELTKDLESGLYVQQPILVDCYGKTFRPCQGTVNILSRGKEENLI